MEKRITETLVELLEQDVLCESGFMKKIDKKTASRTGNDGR